MKDDQNNITSISNTFPTILHQNIRHLSEKSIFEVLRSEYLEGNISNEGLLRFYIACYKLTNVNKSIKDDIDLRGAIDSIAEEYKNQEYDGKVIGYGVTYSKNLFNNPIAEAYDRVKEIFKTNNSIQEIQKGIPQGTTVSINIDTLDLGNKLKVIAEELIDMHGATIDLDGVVKQRTYGIRLTNAKSK